MPFCVQQGHELAMHGVVVRWLVRLQHIMQGVPRLTWDTLSSPTLLAACCVQDCRRLGWACCKALQVLHAAGITHTDIREENTVWLGDDDAMLIDLEYCRVEKSPLPDGLTLRGWDDGTLDMASGKKRYTAASDMYSLGKMLHRLLAAVPGNLSALADDFTRKLMAKELTAAQALAHDWLRHLD